MSIKNILKSGSELEGWNTIYTNKLEVYDTITIKGVPILGKSYGFLTYAGPSPVTPVPIYPTFAEFNEAPQQELLPPELYRRDGAKIEVLNTGLYNVSINVNFRLTNPTFAAYVRFFVDSVPVGVNINSTSMPVGNTNACIQLTQNIFITSPGSKISFGLANLITDGLVMDIYKFEISKIA